MSAGFSPLGIPTRECHRATPEWTRAAVRTVVLLAKRATHLGGGGGWLRLVPVLPPTLWEAIIGLVPVHQIGRAAGAPPVADPGVALWLERQMLIAAAGGWGREADDAASDDAAGASSGAAASLHAPGAAEPGHGSDQM